MSFDEKNQIVILKDTTYDDVFALVEFMYRGEINVAQVSTHFFSWYLFFFFKLWNFHPNERKIILLQGYDFFVLPSSNLFCTEVKSMWLRYDYIHGKKHTKKHKFFCWMCTLIIRHLLTDNFTLLKYVCKYCFLQCLASKEC